MADSISVRAKRQPVRHTVDRLSHRDTGWFTFGARGRNVWPPPHRALSVTAATLTIDLGALVANWRLLSEKCPAAECAAVVKADAYGLGVAGVAPALLAAGCATFFIATVDEGIALRALLGPEPSIVQLHGPGRGEAAALHQADVIPVLNSLEQISEWTEFSQRSGTALPCALHLDTGMNRLGLGAADVGTLARAPDRLAYADVRLVMSHLSSAEEVANRGNRRQLVTFLQRTAAVPQAARSLANSSGIFLGDAYHFDIVRPGVALYGANPVPEQVNPMTEVVHLQGKILQVRHVDVGESVGYGGTFSVAKPTRIATVAAGYADGYLRSLSGCGRAVVGGVPVPVVGRVSMDLITLDVGAVPERHAQPGAPVSLIGGGVALDDVAAAAGTIPYEILTSLGPRYRRVYVPSESP